MIIVFEGPDFAGKSTLARAIVEELGDSAHLIHHGPPSSEHVLSMYERDLRDYVPGSGKHLIFDRLHHGETIYGPLLRGKSLLTPAMQRHIDLLIASRGGVQILLCPSVQVLESRAERGDDLIDVKQLTELHHEYTQLARKSHFDYVYTGATPLYEDVIADAEMHENRCLLLSVFPLYIGDAHPRVLIVGEQPGPNSKGRDGHVMVWAPYPESSGSYLIPALDEALGMDISAYGLCNAVYEDVRGLWKALSCPRTIALGDKASRILKAQGVLHNKVPHPAYWRRFKSKERDLYIGMLKEAARG